MERLNPPIKQKGQIQLPWEAVEIHLNLAQSIIRRNDGITKEDIKWYRVRLYEMINDILNIDMDEKK